MTEKQKNKFYTKEATLKKDARDLFKAAGAKKFMPVPKGYSEGAVDFLVCYLGRYVAIETKVDPKEITALQKGFLKEVIEAGGIGVLAYDLRTIHIALSFLYSNPTGWLGDIIHDGKRKL